MKRRIWSRFIQLPYMDVFFGHTLSPSDKSLDCYFIPVRWKGTQRLLSLYSELRLSSHLYSCNVTACRY